MDKKVGVFIIGALGYISSAVMTGALALKKGLCGQEGMVTGLEPFKGLALTDPARLVFGGWDIRKGSALESANGFFRFNHLPVSEILPSIKDDLEAVSEDIRTGVTTNCGRTIELFAAEAARENAPLEAQVQRLRRDLRQFRERHCLDEVVVFNLASTEPPIELKPCHMGLGALEECLGADRKHEVRASTLYAYASISEGCPYVNFTPSNAALTPALVELSEKKGVPVMGNDGKTGETLVKSALMPMFLMRNLEILSWEGFNILGNMDGMVLEDPQNKESKVLTKDLTLCKSLGYTPHSSVHIHYVPSLDDQKTAWNFIHFKGFLGAKMSLQFVWQGYDSILAAPLVIDLVRLMELSKKRGERGVMTHLASFFKAPLNVDEYRLNEQFELLTRYLKGLKASGAGA